MAKYLVIVESPAKVKTIKKFLGSNYEVAASNGHVRDLPKSTLGIDVENDYVVIARSGDNKKLKVANMMGSTNVGENFVDLKAMENGKEYRLILNDDGKVQIFPKEAVEGHVYAEGDNLQMPLKMATGAGETEKIRRYEDI